MSQLPPHAGPFHRIARTVRRRLFWRAWTTALGSFWWIGLIGLAALAIFRSLGWQPDFWLGPATLAAWVATASAVAWRRLPSPFAALLAWDDASRRQAAFASAWAFELETPATATALDPGRAAHLSAVDAQLTGARSRLSQDLPLPRPRGLTLVPVLIAILAFMPWGRRPIDAADRRISQAMADAARAESEKIAAEARIDRRDSLTDEEKRRLEELEKEMQEAANALAQAAEKTPRELLDELEKQARAAEELARKLGDQQGSWASEALLNEMQKQPDLADLATALKDKAASRSAEEAREVAGRLTDPRLTTEAQERFHQATARTMAQATPEDREKPVGRHTDAAGQKLSEARPAEAAAEFSQLADQLHRLAEREATQQQLQSLADKLREAGASIMGQNGEAMKKLAGASPSEAQAMPDLAPLGEPSPNQGQDNASGALPVPGLPPSGARPSGKAGPPIPGTGPKAGTQGKPIAVVPGTAPKPGADGLPIAAPIPGTAAGGPPIPGAAMPGGQGDKPGGTFAGRGHVDSKGDATKPTAAAAQGNVTATPNQDGESFLTAIEGQPHRESASREAKSAAVSFLKVQEQALDDQALPPDRRQQVRRYFETLRKRFEE